MLEPFKLVQTYDHNKKEWSVTTFEEKEDFRSFLEVLFEVLPGNYGFDECSLMFNEQSRLWHKNKKYCFELKGSRGYTSYWDREKDRCRNGVIYKHNGKTWYLAREYYMWLNFLPIYDKKNKKFRVPELRDAQYQLQLYCKLAELSNKNISLVKKRQMASSYYFAAKLLNYFWFEEKAVCKMFATAKPFIDEEDGTWKYLEEYRDFLNKETAWYRPMHPGSEFKWKQEMEIKRGSKNLKIGLGSTLTGKILDKSPTKGVGGASTFIFHEEAGVAPKLDTTLEFLIPAIKDGMVYTGQFAVAGSVGELKDCEPLKDMTYNPDSKDILPYRNIWLDSKGKVGYTGFFIPEQYSMPPCIDKYGNSLVDEAIVLIDQERIRLKATKTPKDYRLSISQKPKNLEEAFAYREESIYNLELVQEQIRRIEEGQYHFEHVDLKRNIVDESIIETTPAKRAPITEFPVPKKMKDKRGCVVIHERRVENAKLGVTYYASLDPVSGGKVTTTNSLASIYIYKTMQDVTTVKEDGKVESTIEQDVLVAWWSGRYDDVNDTNENISMLIEMYQAWTVVENNVSAFIQYMISKRRQKYLVKKNSIVFNKELELNKHGNDDYGWRNAGTIFKDHIQPPGMDYLEEVLDCEIDEDGNKYDIVYGVTRIRDIMLLKEMMSYKPKLNVDRIIAYSALVAFAKIQNANRGYSKRVDKEEDLVIQEKSVKLNRTPFTNIGHPNKKRSPFSKRRR